MRDPAAFFITGTCYGTWLHGDKRGSIDRRDASVDSPALAIMPALVQYESRCLTHAPIVLTPPARRLVEQAISDHCRVRGWELLASNVRTNHVHLVLEYGGETPERMMGQLKAWSSRRLREAHLIAAKPRIWTRHGSTRYLWNERDVSEAVRYVIEGQDSQ